MSLPTSMKALLDLRASAHEISWRWSAGDDDPDLAWLWESATVPVPGHGDVRVCSLLTARTDKSTAIILRGGLAVALAIEHVWYYDGDRVTSVRIEWIETGVPDHVRRAHIRDERRTRTEAYDLALASIAEEIAYGVLATWERPSIGCGYVDSAAPIPTGHCELRDGANGGTIDRADGVRVSLPGALRRAGVSVAEGERPIDALRRHLDVEPQSRVRSRGMPRMGRAVRRRAVAVL